MANSLGKLWVCALALGSSALAAQDDARQREAPRAKEELTIELQSFEIDNKTNFVHLLAPRIKQGKVSIAADEAVATGDDFQARSGEWQLKGHVRVALESAVITSESAAFTIANNQLTRGELVGQATFEDAQPGGKDPARGGANRIVYDDARQTLRLSENAWFRSDRWQAEGCDIVYNLSTEGLASGSSDCANPFQLRILPKQATEQGNNAAGTAAPQ
jgi:lipopolysaccharide transport protein LptA